MSKQVVAFGDSNTRYYFGDLDMGGPMEEAWPARLEALLRAAGVDARVKNEGWPGEQMDFAMAGFSRLAAGADLCVLGFGTNDVKKLEVPLGLFLSELSDVLDQAEQAGVKAVVLGIPWFEERFAGPEVHARLPVWNESVKSLCRERKLPFVDLYNAFRGEPERWFNERSTPKRHLSGGAQQRVAELVLPLALEALR